MFVSLAKVQPAQEVGSEVVWFKWKLIQVWICLLQRWFSRSEFGAFDGRLCLFVSGFQPAKWYQGFDELSRGLTTRKRTASQTLPTCPPELSSLQKTELLNGSGLWEPESGGRDNQVTVRVSVLLSIESLDMICMET